MNERCFAMQHGGQCGALKGRCPGYAGCGFYKPVWKQKKEVCRLRYRFRSLPEETQYTIAEKYFGGRMPWKEEGEVR